MITDLKKYKRIFAFGCSFTNYLYPTWADLIYKSMSPEAEFYNLGKSGGGNLFISHRIVEANRKYKFNEDDLVVVMWSTFARLDFYRTGHGWVTPGNIYTQGELSESTVREIEDLNWFLMRDLATIDLTTNYLNNLQCDAIKLMSVPIDYEQVNKFNEVPEFTQSMFDLYSDLVASYPQSMFEFMNRKWSGVISYRGDKDMPNDYHPTPVDYANYLIHCGVPITQEAIDYAHESLRRLLTPNITKQEAIELFPDCDKRVGDTYRLLW